MSEEAGNEVAGTPPPAPTKPAIKAAQVLSFIKDNFTLVSAAAVLIGVTLSTTFLAAYLSVFDWHLLWFVQYTDIITFGLLAVGVIGGCLVLIQGTAQTVLIVFKMEGGTTRKQTISFGLLALTMLALRLLAAWLNDEGYFHIFVGAGVLVLVLMIIWEVVRYITTATMPNLINGFFLCLAVAFTAIGLGQWLGYSVRESSKAQDIVLKNKTLPDMRVVIVMSRHTVLFKDDDLFVVPTADITEFKVKGGMLQITIPPEHKGQATVPPAPIGK